MPNNLYCIWTLAEGDANYSLRWRLLKAFFSREIPKGEVIFNSREKRREGGIWQRRFWAHLLTEAGEQLGAIQGEYYRSGIPYARWPESILNVKALKDSIDNLKGIEKSKTDADKADRFRHKFEAKHRSTDGHFVR